MMEEILLEEFRKEVDRLAGEHPKAYKMLEYFFEGVQVGIENGANLEQLLVNMAELMLALAFENPREAEALLKYLEATAMHEGHLETRKDEIDKAVGKYYSAVV